VTVASSRAQAGETAADANGMRALGSPACGVPRVARSGLGLYWSGQRLVHMLLVQMRGGGVHVAVNNWWVQ
jgi:hypothetical protein